MTLLYKEVIKPDNTNYLNSSMVFNFGLHFNLDKNTNNQNLFIISRFSLGADFFSQNVLNGGLFLNTISNTYFNRAQINNSFGLGIGGALGLKN